MVQSSPSPLASRWGPHRHLRPLDQCKGLQLQQGPAPWRHWLVMCIFLLSMSFCLCIFLSFGKVLEATQRLAIPFHLGLPLLMILLGRRARRRKMRRNQDNRRTKISQKLPRQRARRQNKLMTMRKKTPIMCHCMVAKMTLMMVMTVLKV